MAHPFSFSGAKRRLSTETEVCRNQAGQDDSYRMQSLYQRTEQLLGEGTYGKVYLGIHKQTRRAVAMKMMHMDTNEEGLSCTFLREIGLLKALRHKHVVELLDMFVLSCGRKTIAQPC